MKIKGIRKKIDGIDGEIIKLLSERSRLVNEAGKRKKNEQEVRDHDRVERVIRHVRIKAEREGFDPQAAERIYRSIIGSFISREMEQFRKERAFFPDI